VAQRDVEGIRAKSSEERTKNCAGRITFCGLREVVLPGRLEIEPEKDTGFSASARN